MKSISLKIKALPWEKIFLLLDQMLVSGSNFILGILLVRALGLESYGVFAILWMLVLFALGINQAVITKPMLSIAPKLEKTEAAQYMMHVQWLQGSLAAFIFIVAMTIWLMSDSLGLVIPYLDFAPILAGILFFQLHHDYFRKRCFIEGQVLRAFCIDIILYLGQVILIGGLWFQNQLNLSFVLYSILIASGLSVLVACWQTGIQLTNKTDLMETWKRQFEYSKWLLGTAILQWFSGNYFIIIGATIIGPVAVGALRMVQNVMGFFHILFLLMENIVPIEAARQHVSGGWKALINYMKNVTLKIGIIFLVLLIGVAIFSPWVIKMLYGPEYLDFSYIVVVYCALYILVFSSLPLQFILRTIELTYPLFIAYLAATAFSLITANFFLQTWGMSGLLAGLILTQLITVSVYIFFIWRKTKISNLQDSTLKISKI